VLPVPFECPFRERFFKLSMEPIMYDICKFPQQWFCGKLC
jgi:hypothetical protein